MVYLSNGKSGSPLKWILRRIRRFIPAIIGVAVLNALLSVSYVAVALISREIIDNAADKNKLFISAAILVAIVVAELLTSTLLSVINVRINGKMTISLRNYMFSSLVHKKYPGLFDHHTGDILNRFTSDIDQIVTGATSIVPSVVAMISKLIAGMVALFAMNPYFAAIVLVLGTTLPMLGRTISKRYKYMHKEVQRTEGQARSFLQESFANIVVIKTFISETPILKKLNEYMKANLRMKIKRNFISALITLCLHSFFTLGYYVVLIWGATQLAHGLTYGTLNAYLQLFSQLRAPLQNVSGILPQYYSTLASAERLIEFENIEDEPPVIVSDSLSALKENFDGIRVENLAFSYDDEVILRNCSFTVPRGEITAIMGESGSGKSTLFKILLGLYEPDGGSISFGNGTPINAGTRGMFSYVPQGNMILSGTIRDNITLCNENISDEQIEKATRAAVIYDFIQELPDGFDTVLSERGAGLSEGQIQRVSIARALLFDAPILLLDESTSALDEQTETTLLSNIKHMTDKTVLFITHRNTSVNVCDHIIHVENKKFTALK